jgi:hypothetical protein
LYVYLNFVDLANPKLSPTIRRGDQRFVYVGDQRGQIYVTAGEAQVIAEAWNRIADEIVERERGAA